MRSGAAARPPIGVQLYSVRDDLAADPAATLGRLAALGFRTVEPFDLVAVADRLAGPMADLGLRAPTTHVPFVDGGLGDALAAAARLGVGTIIEPWLPEERWVTREDADAIAAEVSDIDGISPEIRDRNQVLANGLNWNTQVNGVGPDYTYVRSWAVVQGTMFSEQEVKSLGKVAVIGKTVVTLG